jgi:cell wall-associated NlpC family hydrolase
MRRVVLLCLSVMAAGCGPQVEVPGPLPLQGTREGADGGVGTAVPPADGGAQAKPPVSDAGRVPPADAGTVPPADAGSVPPGGGPGTAAYAASLTADFPWRDTLPQTTTPESQWFATSEYGPKAATYPAPQVPSWVADPVRWKRERVLAAGRHFLGVPYAHLHIPDAGGLDCSNFTAWAYNYGLGLRFTSNVLEQAAQAGRRLAPGEPLQPGDLLFIWNSARTEIGHAALYVDPGLLLDSTSSDTPDGVNVRAFDGWYRTRFAYARRVLE